MTESMRQLSLVPQQILIERMESVKILRENDEEMYEISKDRLTGEHYLHYGYGHLTFTPQENVMEQFHYLLPLNADNVIDYILGDEPYDYPEYWQGSFLRNGPNGKYVWFDPMGTEETDGSEQRGKKMKQELMAFKQKKNYDQKSIEQFLDKIDKLWEE